MLAFCLWKGRRQPQQHSGGARLCEGPGASRLRAAENAWDPCALRRENGARREMHPRLPCRVWWPRTPPRPATPSRTRQECAEDDSQEGEPDSPTCRPPGGGSPAPGKGGVFVRFQVKAWPLSVDPEFLPLTTQVARERRQTGPPGKALLSQGISGEDQSSGRL